MLFSHVFSHFHTALKNFKKYFKLDHAMENLIKVLHPSLLGSESEGKEGEMQSYWFVTSKLHKFKFE